MLFTIYVTLQNTVLHKKIYLTMIMEGHCPHLTDEKL